MLERALQRKPTSSHRADAAVGKLSIPLLRRLKVGAVSDPLERQADQIAEQVAQLPYRTIPDVSSSNDIRRKCACGSSQVTGVCTKCNETHETMQRATTEPGDLGFAPSIVHDVLNSPGQPLDSASRAFFEPRFGHDFGRVRIHHDARAAESARSVNALAYAVGRDIVFDTGHYAPHTIDGRKLLAHELTHVVQQNSADVIWQATSPTPSPLPPTVPPPGPGDFELTRVDDSTADEIFFAKNSSSLSTDANTQIASIRSSAPSSVKLFGFSSADETATVAQARADKVKARSLPKPPAA